jgi:hypothetical protein
LTSQKWCCMATRLFYNVHRSIIKWNFTVPMLNWSVISYSGATGVVVLLQILKYSVRYFEISFIWYTLIYCIWYIFLLCPYFWMVPVQHLSMLYCTVLLLQMQKSRKLAHPNVKV